MDRDFQEPTLPNNNIYRSSIGFSSDKTHINSVDNDVEATDQVNSDDEDEDFKRQRDQAIANSLRDSAGPTTRANSEMRTTPPSELNEGETNEGAARRTDSDSDEQPDQRDQDLGGNLSDTDDIPPVPRANRRKVWVIELQLRKAAIGKISHVSLYKSWKPRRQLRSDTYTFIYIPHPLTLRNLSKQTVIMNEQLNIRTSISAGYGSSVDHWIETQNVHRNSADLELYPSIRRREPTIFARFVLFNPDLKLLHESNYDVVVDNVTPRPVLVFEKKKRTWATVAPRFDDGRDAELMLETCTGAYLIEVKRGLGDKDTKHLNLVRTGRKGFLTNNITLDTKMALEIYRMLERPVCLQWKMGLRDKEIARMPPSTTGGGGGGGGGGGAGGNGTGAGFDRGDVNDDQTAGGGGGSGSGNKSRYPSHPTPGNSHDRKDKNTTQAPTKSTKRRKEADMEDEQDQAVIRRARLQSLDRPSPSRVQPQGANTTLPPGWRSLRSLSKRPNSNTEKSPRRLASQALGTSDNEARHRYASPFSSTPRLRRGMETVKVEGSDDDDNNEHTENRSIRSGSRGLPPTAAKTSVPGGHVFPWANPGRRLGTTEEP